jgi:hypothetical protein
MIQIKLAPIYSEIADALPVRLAMMAILAAVAAIGDD